MADIDVVLIESGGELRRGGIELIDRWRADSGSCIWVDVRGGAIAADDPLMTTFGLHELALRDAHRQRHPPKLEVFEDHLFLLLSELDGHETTLDFEVVQLAMFAGRRFLVTRHDTASTSIDYWRKAPELAVTLRSGAIRLALEISITAARRYVDMLLEFEPRLSELEDELQDKPDDRGMRDLTQYRTRLRKLRRLFDYHAGAFEDLRTVKMDFFNASSKENRHLVMDVFEKYERLLSLSTLYYELAGDLVDGYISLTNHALNNTMRVLTAITAIFVPLSFLAGVYGMNFEYMPELAWKGAYFVVLGIMGGIIVAMLALFRKYRWL